MIADGVEGPKVDFKLTLKLDTAAEKVEFCKDLSAIANSDGRQFGGYGYIIIGASSGKLLGGVDAWKDGGADKFSARLSQVTKENLAPPPGFHFVAYADDRLGDWGVVVVPPSSEQPHLIIKELSGNPARHEWFVRVNDTTERASVADYSRVLATATRRALAPLELELQSMRRELASRSDVNLPQLFAALANAPGGQALSESSPNVGSVASRVRQALATPLSGVEDAILSEALQLKRVMVEERPENPQRFSDEQSAELLKPLTYMEEQTKPFAEAIVAVVRHDREGRLSNAVVQAFELLSEEPRLNGAHWEYAMELRLYPLVLSLHALAFASVAQNDGRVLRRVLDLPLRSWNDGVDWPIISSLRSLRAAKDFFNQALGKQRYYEPIAERMFGIVPLWCADIVPGQRGQDLFFAAEFVLALEHTKLGTLRGSGIPFTGRFAYSYDATRTLERLLRSRPKVLVDVFGDAVEKRLEEFDANIPRVVEGGFRQGFAGGALAAWRGDA